MEGNFYKISAVIIVIFTIFAVYKFTSDSKISEYGFTEDESIYVKTFKDLSSMSGAAYGCGDYSLSNDILDVRSALQNSIQKNNIFSTEEIQILIEKSSNTFNQTSRLFSSPNPPIPCSDINSKFYELKRSLGL